jgi:hypothetical protein
MHRRLALVLVLVASAALLLSACGTSKSEQAKNTACTARDNTRAQVDKLQNLTTGKPTPKQFQAVVSEMNAQVAKIKAVQGDLASPLGPQTALATKTFDAGLKIAAGRYVAAVGKNASVARALGFLPSLGTSYGSVYYATLARMACG